MPPTTKRKTVVLLQRQDDFIKRKTAELRQLAAPGDEDKVTESGVLQGLIDFWMAFESRRKTAEVSPHK